MSNFVGVDIIACIQSQVDLIVNEKYKNDNCPPEYIVSTLFEGSKSENNLTQKIILTIIHNNSQFSSVLFPQHDSLFGFDSLEHEMKQLYNQTM